MSFPSTSTISVKLPKLPFNEVPFTATQRKVHKELLQRYEDIIEQENRYIPSVKILYKTHNSNEIYEYGNDGIPHHYPSIDLSKEYEQDLVVSPDTSVSSSSSSFSSSSSSSTVMSVGDEQHILNEIDNYLPRIPAATITSYNFLEKGTTEIPVAFSIDNESSSDSAAYNTKRIPAVTSTWKVRHHHHHHNSSSCSRPNTDHSSSFIIETVDNKHSHKKEDADADIYPSTVITSNDKMDTLMNPLVNKLHQALRTASASRTPPPPSCNNENNSVSQVPVVPLVMTNLLPSRSIQGNSEIPTIHIPSPSKSTPSFINSSGKSSASSILPVQAPAVATQPNIPPTSSGSTKSESVQVLEALTNLVQTLHTLPSSIPSPKMITLPSTTINNNPSLSTLNNTSVPEISKLLTPPRTAKIFSPRLPTSPLSSPNEKNVSIPEARTNSPTRTTIATFNLPTESSSILLPIIPSSTSLGAIQLQSSKYLHNSLRSTATTTDDTVSLVTIPSSLPSIPVLSPSPATVPIGNEFTKLSQAYQQLESLRNQLHRMKHSN